MNLDEIMKEIKGGLTGHNRKDIAYLYKKMEKYKNHENAKEILSECSKLIYERVYDDGKRAVNKAALDSVEFINAAMSEINRCAMNHNTKRAVALSTKLIRQIEKDMPKNDDHTEYYSFAEPFEKILFASLYKNSKTVKNTLLPYSAIYLTHGSLLCEEKRFLDARAAMEKARRWNPVSADACFGYMETLKAVGETEKLFDMAKATFRCSYKRKSIAHCYRNLGYCFTEMGLLKPAVSCYFESLIYDRMNKAALSEIIYIQSISEEHFKTPSKEFFKACAEKYSFPSGASNEVISAALSGGQYLLDNNNKEGAVYCYNIAYQLTGDKDLREIVRRLKEE